MTVLKTSLKKKCLKKSEIEGDKTYAWQIYKMSESIKSLFSCHYSHAQMLRDTSEIYTYKFIQTLFFQL
jgi:hypothetical protein